MFNSAKYRFTIERHDELPESYKQAHRDSGVDPDTIWVVVWSFETAEAATKCFIESVEEAGKHQTFRLVDQGKPQEVETTTHYGSQEHEQELIEWEREVGDGEGDLAHVW